MSIWLPVAKTPSLGSHDLHLWKAYLPKLSGWQNAISLLREDEIERANKFRFTVDRSRFALSRALLRLLLSNYLSCGPKEFLFNYSKFGKPSIDKYHKLTFNISHAKNVAIFGFCAGHQIGVDVEYHQNNIDVEDLAMRFFSKSERNYIVSLPASEQLEAFFACWTRKESFIKAHGSGLSLPLDQFSVSVSSHQEPQLLEVNWGKFNVSDWTMRSFTIHNDYSAASIMKCVNPIISTFSVEGLLTSQNLMS